MEKIIFFGLVIPIFGFVLYLGGSAIMKGFKAKNENKSEVLKDKEFDDLSNNNEQLSDEISRLNNLRQRGVLTQEEFEKAKNKILGN